MKMKLLSVLSVVVVMASMAVIGVEAQKGNKTTIMNPYLEVDDLPVGAQMIELAGGARLIKYNHALPQVNAATSENWALHNADLTSTRFSSLDQVDTSNVQSLTPQWLYQTGIPTNPQSTPIVVDGVMYATDSRWNVYALDAATGQSLWRFRVDNLIGGGEQGIANRGAVYGDGAVYVAAGPSVFALNAQTGMPLEGFGDQGRADVLLTALKDKYPDIEQPVQLGYAFTAAPQYYNGVVFIGASLSEAHVPGGLFFAIDAKTGKTLWQFNSVPQGPEDEGWDIAKDTWQGGVRNGGGIWETPSIDPELGMVYVSCTNPSPDNDGSARLGTNLFTNSIVALDVSTGKIKWYFQEVHHDIWDYDSVSTATLFDMQVRGQTVKALAQAQKNCYLYILNRETGQPVHPIVEVPVPTATDVPGEEVWPTQPLPFTAAGRPMQPFAPIYSLDIPAEYAPLVTPYYTPTLVGKNIVQVPGRLGGTNFAPSSFSPVTGLVYVTAIDSPQVIKALSVGNTLRPGGGDSGAVIRGPYLKQRGLLTAYDPSSGELIWQSELQGRQQAGSLVTAGNLVFVGDPSGVFYAFDARTGDTLWKFNAGSSVKSSPSTYEVNGRQFIAVNAGDVILSFALGQQ